MRKLLAGLPAGLLTGLAGAVLAAGTSARDLDADQAVMAYVQVPIAASGGRERTPSVGLRLDARDRDARTSLPLGPRPPALMDLRLDREGVRAWTVRGVDLLPRVRTAGANGEGGVNWPVVGLVVGAAVAGAVVIQQVASDADDDDSSEPAPAAEPLAAEEPPQTTPGAELEQ